jgi:hypothetical protein
MADWSLLRDFARSRFGRENFPTFLWGSISIVTAMSVYAVLRGLFQTDWAMFALGLALIGLAVALLIVGSGPIYWLRFVRDRRRRQDGGG